MFPFYWTSLPKAKLAATAIFVGIEVFLAAPVSIKGIETLINRAVPLKYLGGPFLNNATSTESRDFSSAVSGTLELSCTKVGQLLVNLTTNQKGRGIKRKCDKLKTGLSTGFVDNHESS